jgi:Reverse transcriptase (RNA-dependent DNA polymerase)
VISDPEEPKTFNQAWFSDLKERSDWRAAIKKELEGMQTRKVWRVISLDKVPPDRKVIGSK